ncbi:MAG: hypothetical protein K8F52_17910 [Candidatus Scalindua rubra]|uniref:Uncharacterized protein n=1 Tax=Candidatus Scalindua brodae TaxID=237368 RepID=A0A0B0ETP0_9BACT|nr:MAG: hypothetical protein SCABRO_00178 [Candidatus Scalindua brodae]MBZ0110532.1 hypothetical protein [Candidatus Scalindua rubra]TWU30771.1 hypothetical protein S225a_24280 [Candidatus Brocadiaceae bacterium S225]
MHLSGMNQLATAVKESFATITIDRRTEENNIKKILPSIQNRYIDSAEFSDRALELSIGTETETNSNEKLDTDQEQEENPEANQQQPVCTGTVSLNVFA